MPALTPELLDQMIRGECAARCAECGDKPCHALADLEWDGGNCGPEGSADSCRVRVVKRILGWPVERHLNRDGLSNLLDTLGDTSGGEEHRFLYSDGDPWTKPANPLRMFPVKGHMTVADFRTLYHQNWPDDE